MIATEESASEARVRHLSQVLRAIRKIHCLIGEERVPQRLLEESCKILVETRGYVTVWVGVPEDGPEKKVTPVAHAGSGGDFTKTLAPITWDEKPTGQGPSGTAIRERRAVVIDDIAADPRFALWRAPVAATGAASIASVPILLKDRMIGAITVKADRVRAFDSEELGLLKDLANDLGHALQSIEDVAARRHAEETLRESEARYRMFFEGAADGILVTDAKTMRLRHANPSICRMLGYAHEELMRFGVEDIHPPDDLPHVASELAAVSRGEKTATPAVRLRRKDGSIFYADIHGFPAVIDGRKSIVGFFSDVSERKRAEERVQVSAAQLRKTFEGIVKSMAAAIEMRDPYTAGHEKRVARLACAIAAEMGLSQDAIDGVRIAAYLHDIGKIAVPAEILSKPGKITDYEFGIIKTHPQFGYDILKEIDFPWPVAIATLQHHERLNGSGYPLGITQEKIIAQSRILAVADVVEAMSSHRPYRPALGAEAAMAEICENKDTLYDAQVVDACNALISGKRFQFADAGR